MTTDKKPSERLRTLHEAYLREYDLAYNKNLHPAVADAESKYLAARDAILDEHDAKLNALVPKPEPTPDAKGTGAHDAVEYDGAFKCLRCKAEWGALPGKLTMPEKCNPSSPAPSGRAERARDFIKYRGGGTWTIFDTDILTAFADDEVAEVEKRAAELSLQVQDACNCLGRERDRATTAEADRDQLRARVEAAEKMIEAWNKLEVAVNNEEARLAWDGIDRAKSAYAKSAEEKKV